MSAVMLNLGHNSSHAYGYNIWNEVHIRRICPQDIQCLQELCEECFPIKYDDVWYNHVTNGQYFYPVAAILNGKIVGILVADLVFKWCSDEADENLWTLTRCQPESPMVYILALAVLKEFRRLGIGSLLLNRLIKAITTELDSLRLHESVGGIYLHVQCKNKAAIKFYERQNFKLHRYLPYYYFLDDGCDAYSFVLDLNNEPSSFYPSLAFFRGAISFVPDVFNFCKNIANFFGRQDDNERAKELEEVLFIVRRRLNNNSFTPTSVMRHSQLSFLQLLSSSSSPSPPPSSLSISKSGSSHESDSFLTWTLNRIFSIVSIENFISAFKEGVISRTICTTCQILSLLFTSNSLSTYSALLSGRIACVTFRVQKSHICNEMIDHIQNLFHYVRRNSRLTADEMCGVSIGISCAYEVTNKLNWTIDIPESKKNKIFPNQKISSNKSFADEKIFYVGTIADIHIDLLYVPGAKSDCSEPVCCRPYHGISSQIEGMAGLWGTYAGCDTPLVTVHSTLQQLRNSEFNLTYIISVGDVVPHDVWNYRRAKTLGLVDILDLSYAENLKVPIYSIIGNHEAIPVNCFSPPLSEIQQDELAIDWLYTSLAEKWKKWIPSYSYEEFKKSGNYVIKIRKGFRIISINTNYCARMNLWILYESVDLGGTLNFLLNALQEAEDDGDNVHIVGHIPPDHRECTQAWLHNFLSILERYHPIVKAQFYGHTHRDEFRVYYSLKDPEKPISFALVNPSLTSYSQTNPAYRIFKFSENGDLLDYYTYFFNLTDNQFRQKLKWQLGYQASDFYGYNSFNANTFDEIYNRLEQEDDFFSKYYRIYFALSDVEVTKFWDERKKKLVMSDIRIKTPMEITPHVFRKR